jgi:hypothetical protein
MCVNKYVRKQPYVAAKKIRNVGSFIRCGYNNHRKTVTD